MTVYVSDTFTASNGTLLSAHTPDTGSAWTVGANSPVIQSNACQANDFEAASAYNTASVPSDYEIAADLTLGITGVSASGGLIARVGSFLGPFEWYFADWSDPTQEWRIGYYYGYGPTVLDTHVDSGFTSGTKAMLFTLTGSSLTLAIDGIVRVGVTDSTYTTGPGGLYIGSAPGGAIILDNFSLSSGGAPPGIHAGLTGAGTISVGTISAVLLTIDTAPSYLGTGKGNPARYFDLGNISFGRDGYFSRNYYLEHLSERVQAPFGGVDTVAYSIASPASLTITEIP